MNIIKNLIERLIEARGSNKNFPCPTYSTEARAEKAVAEVALKASTHFTKPNETVVPANHIVVFVPAWNRWVGAVDMNELIRRNTSTGGYLGIAAPFFSY